MKMKNFMLLIILLIFVPNIAKAKNLNICNYDLAYENSTRRVEIWYVFGESKWNVIYYDADNDKYAKTGNFKQVFEEGRVPEITLDTGTKEILQNFDCPEYAIIDYDSIDQLCFSNNSQSSFCKSYVGAEDMGQIGNAQKALLNSLEGLKNKIVESATKEFENLLLFNNVSSSEEIEKLKEEMILKLPNLMQKAIKEFFYIDDFNEIPQNLYNRIKELQTDTYEALKQSLKQSIEELKNLFEIENPFPNINNGEENNVLENYDNLSEIIELEEFITQEDMNAAFENMKPVIPPINDCETLLGSPRTKNSPAWYLSFIFSVIKYVAIIILIVLTIMDFVGAVASHDNDILKKAVGKAIKRMILCVIIFLLPTLIEFILEIINEKELELCINTNRNG